MKSVEERVIKLPGGCGVRDPGSRRDSGPLQSRDHLKDVSFDRVRHNLDLGHAVTKNGSVIRETLSPRFAVGSRRPWPARVAGAKGGLTGLQGG